MAFTDHEYSAIYAVIQMRMKRRRAGRRNLLRVREDIRLFLASHAFLGCCSNPSLPAHGTPNHNANNTIQYTPSYEYAPHGPNFDPWSIYSWLVHVCSITRAWASRNSSSSPAGSTDVWTVVTSAEPRVDGINYVSLSDLLREKLYSTSIK
jgi:hypothetical protein